MRSNIIFFFGCIGLSLPMHAFSRIESTSLVGVLGLTTWGLFERYKKNQNAKAMERLEQEVNLYKSEANQVAADEEFLSTLATVLEKNAGTYSFAQDQSFESLYKQLKALVVQRGGIEMFACALTEDLAYVTDRKNQLEVKMIHWSNKRPAILPKAEGTLAQCMRIQSILNELVSFFDVQKNFMALDLVMDHATEKCFKEEKDLINTRNNKQYTHKLHTLILKRCSEVECRFPYIKYVDLIKTDKNKLETTLNRLKGFESQGFQEAMISEARILLRCLEQIFEIVISSPLYEQQKAEKPAFDQAEQERQRQIDEKKARLATELREKEHYAEARRQEAERNLSAERTKAQSAANEKARIESRNREIELEGERIRQQEAIRRAVEENERSWRSRMDGAKTQISQLADALNVGIHVGAEHQQGLDRYLNLLRGHLNAARSALN